MRLLAPSRRQCGRVQKETQKCDNVDNWLQNSSLNVGGVPDSRGTLIFQSLGALMITQSTLK